MSSRHKGQMDEKEKRLPPLNLTLKLIERLRNAKSKQTNCNVLAHNNNPPTPLSPMNTERDNSRCNFVILLNNVTRYPCQHIPRFFSLFRPTSRLACTQIRMSITGVWQATFANRSVKRSFTKTGTRKYAYFVNRSGLSSFYYYYLFTLRFFLISFIARLLYSVLMCIRGSTVFEDRFRHARTKISIEACLFILPEFTLDETRWRDRETMVWPIFFYIDFKVGLPIFFRYAKFHHFTFQIDLVYTLQIILLFEFRKNSVEF